MIDVTQCIILHAFTMFHLVSMKDTNQMANYSLDFLTRPINMKIKPIPATQIQKRSHRLGESEVTIPKTNNEYKMITTNSVNIKAATSKRFFIVSP